MAMSEVDTFSMTQTVPPQTDGWVTRDEDGVRDLLDRLQPGVAVLEYKTTGSSSLAGNVDTVRRLEDRDRLQVRSGLIGRPVYVEEERAVDELVGRPLRLLEAGQ